MAAAAAAKRNTSKAVEVSNNEESNETGDDTDAKLSNHFAGVEIAATAAAAAKRNATEPFEVSKKADTNSDLNSSKAVTGGEIAATAAAKRKEVEQSASDVESNFADDQSKGSKANFSRNNDERNIDSINAEPNLSIVMNIDDDPSHDFEFLNNLVDDVEDISSLQLLDLLLDVACSNVSNAPNDIALYFCLHQIYYERFNLSKKSFDKGKAVKALEASLDIIEHSNAVGMFGWLVYGTSNVLDRMLERPFEALNDLACFHASQNNWHTSADVLRSIVLRCEQHLPLYHPITIAALVDLSASLQNLGDNNSATKISRRASRRLKMYLQEQENACFMMHDMQSSNRNPNDKVVQYKYHKLVGLDHLAMLQAFVGNMRYLKRRKMMSILGTDHPMYLLFICFLGDSHSVLAASLEFESKQYSLSFNLTEKDRLYRESQTSWSVAGSFYRTALKGWSWLYGTHHPNIPATTCSMARCLHELGRTSEAIRVLLSVTSARNVLNQKPRCTQTTRNHQGIDDVSDVVSHADSSILSLNPPNFDSERANSSLQINLRYGQSIAICKWSIAVYTLKENPNEGSKIKALSLLERAKEDLVQESRRFGKTGDTSIDIVTEDLLNTLKKESQRLRYSKTNRNRAKVSHDKNKISMKDQRTFFVSV